MLERMKNVLRNRKEEGDKGFSLVELAVVIAIIAILVAIAVPVFMSMNGAATEARNKANAANGASMVAAYLANNSGEAAYANVRAELDKLKNDGTTVTSTLTPGSGNVTLSNFCVTVAGESAGPCPA